MTTWNEQAEHNRDLEYESRLDFESWEKEPATTNVSNETGDTFAEPNEPKMTPKDIRTAISNQCGFNKAKHRQDLQVKPSPERLAKLESICQHHPNKAKTQQGAHNESR